MKQTTKHPADDDHPVQGEGNIDAARRYNAQLRKHLNAANTQDEARQAAPRGNDEAAELERAERRGRERAREEDPQVRRPRGAGQ